MEHIELAVRGGGILLTLLMAVLLLRDAGRKAVGRLAALLSVGVGAYLVCSAPGFHELAPIIHFPLLVLCVSNPVLFWLLARALFDDAFRLRPVYGLFVIALLFAKAMQVLVAGAVGLIGGFAVHAIDFGLVVHALWTAYQGRADDLSEERRSFRLPFVLGVGVYSVIILMAELALRDSTAPVSVRLVHVGIIFSLALTFALRLISLRANDLLVPQPSMPPAEATLLREQEADYAALARLDVLMREQEIWRQEGLTITKLADQVGIPEYRLRRLINKALGHRNFSGVP